MIGPNMLEGTSIEYADFGEVFLGPGAFNNSKLKTYVLNEFLFFIAPLAFDGLDDLEIIYNGCDHPAFIIGDHEIIERSTMKLITTYGRLPSAYIVPNYVKKLGTNSIVSRPIRNEDGEIADYGVTTLIIPGNVECESYPLESSPYIYNLCYGVTLQSQYLYSESIKRVFVTDNYMRPIWSLAPVAFGPYNVPGLDHDTPWLDVRYSKVIVGECQSSTPYKEFSKGNFYAQPENPQIMIPIQAQNLVHQNCLLDINEQNDSTITPSTVAPTKSITISSQFSTETTTTTNGYILTDDTDGKSKSSLLLIVLIIFAVIEVVMIVILCLIIYMKRKEPEEEESDQEPQIPIETAQTVHLEDNTAITNENPLFNTKSPDDPFKDDFEEQNPIDQFSVFDNSIVDKDIENELEEDTKIDE